MAQNTINMPGTFGGLMRYNEEYKSRFMISPKGVLIFILFVIAFATALKIFFPISAVS